jgi:hypothetical protein
MTPWRFEGAKNQNSQKSGSFRRSRLQGRKIIWLAPAQGLPQAEPPGRGLAAG